MKLSMYNKILGTNDENLYILYNSITDIAFLINKKVKETLEMGEFSKLGKERIKRFQDAGIIIADNINELEIARKVHENAFHDCTFMQFTIATTYACNLSCFYCYQRHEDFYTKSMDKETSERVIRFIKNQVTKNNSRGFAITLYGGEPFLNFVEGFRIIESLHKWAKKAGKAFFANACTNGTLLTKDIVKKMKKHSLIDPKFPTFIVTLDGPKEIHDTIKFYKGGKGSFDDIINNLKIVKKAKLPFVIKFNVHFKNYVHVKNLVDDLIKMGFKGAQITTSIMVPIFAKLANSELDFPEVPNPHRVIIELEKYAIKRGLQIFNEAVLYRGCNCKNLTDGAYVIDPYGDVYKCWTLMGQQEHKVGTIDNNGYIKNFRSCLLAKRDLFSIEKCKKCPNLLICGGNCAAFCYLTTGKYQSAICMPNPLIDHIVKVRLRRKYPSKLKNLIY